MPSDLSAPRGVGPDLLWGLAILILLIIGAVLGLILLFQS